MHPLSSYLWFMHSLTMSDRSSNQLLMNAASATSGQTLENNTTWPNYIVVGQTHAHSPTPSSHPASYLDCHLAMIHVDVVLG